jgi:cytochrome c-type biogenesis protein CcmH/NrfG
MLSSSGLDPRAFHGEGRMSCFSMRRDTVVFTVAGVVFGFVLGYMSAHWGLLPSPPGVAAAAAPPAREATNAVPAAVDPNEVRALEDLASRAPQDVGARVELGNLFMDHDRWDDAIRWYKEAVALDPKQPAVLTDLGACLVSARRPEEGLPYFEQALAIDGSYRNALYNKGLALVQLGRTDEGLAAWETLLREHPADPQLQGLRAQIDRLRRGGAGGGA